MNSISPQERTVTTIISSAALLLSLTVFIQNRLNGRRDLLLKMHNQLLDADQQHGRRLLFLMTEGGQGATELPEEEFSAINQALSQLNVLAYLHRKRYVPRRDVIELWGLTTARAWLAAEAVGFIALRDNQNVSPVWPFLRAFASHLITTDTRIKSLQAQLNSPNTPPLPN
jgi:hypothetical protein